MVCAVLAFPLPLEKHFHHILALRFTANQKQRGEMQHKKRHSQLPPRQLTSVCSSHSVWKGGNHTQYRQKKNPPTNKCFVHWSCWMLSPSISTSYDGRWECSGSGTVISHTCFASSWLSSPNPDCMRITQRFLWQSTHICFPPPHTSPSEIQQAQFPSLPIRCQISHPLSLLIMIWKQHACFWQRVLSHYRSREGERGSEETVRQKKTYRTSLR